MIDQRFFGWIEKFKEPQRSCFEALIVLLSNKSLGLESKLKWGSPFFDYKHKMCCYLWVDKKTQWPYIAFFNCLDLNHPLLKKESNRKLIRRLLIDPSKDIRLKEIKRILSFAKQKINQKLSVH